MSAWNEIVYADHSDYWTAMCDRALAEVRREQRREDATKIRKFKAVAGHTSVKPEAVREILEWAALEVAPEVSDG